MTDLLTVRDLKVDFTVHGDQLRAVDGVSFRVRQGGTTALVGESGSGKSVCSQAIMGILPNIGSIAGGEICSPTRAATAPRSTWPSSNAMAARCDRSAAAGCR